jgi:glycosyltransferase 2 family protein
VSAAVPSSGVDPTENDARPREADADTGRWRRLLGSLWFRGLVTALLLGLVLTQVDFSAAASSLVDAEWGWFAAAVALMAVGVVVGGLRWYLLLQAAAIRLPRREVIRAFSLSLLLNSLLPTAVGGDAVRAWIVGKPTRQYVGAATSVLLDKATALICLFVVAWTALLLDPSPVPRSVVGVFAWTTVLFVGATAVAAAAAAGSARLAHRLPQRAQAAAEHAWSALHGSTRSPKLLAWVFTLGIAYQLIAVAALVLVAKAIGLGLAFSLAAASAAVVIVATLFPISIGGFGVREGGFVVLLGEAGISATDATLLSLLSVVVIVFASAATLMPLAIRPGVVKGSATEVRGSRG